MNDQMREETHTGLRHTAALHNPWVITGLLFLVTGGLGHSAHLALPRVFPNDEVVIDGGRQCVHGFLVVGFLAYHGVVLRSHR